MRIAIVDDSKTEQERLSVLISAWAHDEAVITEVFDSGEAFAEALHKKRYELVFMDIIMDGNKNDSGSGSHIFVLTGQWSGNNPIVWDNHSAQDKGGKSYVYTRNRSVIAIVRLK